MRPLASGPRLSGWVAHVAVRYRYLVVAVTVVGLAVINRQVSLTDYFVFAHAGSFLWRGCWGSVFADKTIQAGPIQLALLSAFRPLATLRPHLDVTVLHIVGSLATGCGIMWGGGRFRRALARPPAPHVELAVAGLAVWSGLIDDSSALGHPAQVAIPALWVIAAIASRRARPLVAGTALAAATGFETWALLGVGVLLVSPSVRAAVRAAAVAAGVTAAMWLPFIVTGPFNMLRMHWEVSPGTLVAQVFGRTAFTSTMRLTQLAVAIVASGGVALLTRRRDEAVWLVPMTAVVARLTFDPLQFSYYWIAPFTLALLALMCTTWRREAPTVVTFALTYCQVIAFDGAAKPEMIAASVGLLALSIRYSRRRAASVPERCSMGDRVDECEDDVTAPHHDPAGMPPPSAGGPRQTRTADILVVSEAL